MPKFTATVSLTVYAPTLAKAQDHLYALRNYQTADCSLIVTEITQMDRVAPIATQLLGLTWTGSPVPTTGEMRAHIAARWERMSRSPDRLSVAYTFGDGSILTVRDEEANLGFPDCWCFASGPSAGCTAPHSPPALVREG